jgi:hypothetical protein
MYQINPPILQIDFGVSSLRKTTPYDYLNIRSKNSLEEYHFEVVDNKEGTIWVKIFLDRLRPVAFEAETNVASSELYWNESAKIMSGIDDMETIGMESFGDCDGDECIMKSYKLSKFAQETSLNESTSIDLEIIIREGLVKTSIDKYFDGVTIQHTLNFVPHYRKYTCKSFCL